MKKRVGLGYQIHTTPGYRLRRPFIEIAFVSRAATLDSRSCVERIPYHRDVVRDSRPGDTCRAGEHCLVVVTLAPEWHQVEIAQYSNGYERPNLPENHPSKLAGGESRCRTWRLNGYRDLRRWPFPVKTYPILAPAPAQSEAACGSTGHDASPRVVNMKIPQEDRSLPRAMGCRPATDAVVRSARSWISPSYGILWTPQAL